MSEEIELKFLVEDSDVINKIQQLIEQLDLSYTHNVKQLKNQYFDTKLDFGLRTRQYQSAEHQSSEQTIKTAGQVVGGLHKRPEYNVDIEGNYPELSLFPADIWPQTTNVALFQQQLICLFSTDFERHTWCLTTANNSQIELVFDSGQITSGDQFVEINEIELELSSGQQSDLFDLARNLVRHIAVRPGIESKAARGYQLFHKKPHTYPENLPLIQIAVNAPLNDVFYRGMSSALTHLQQSVAGYIAKPNYQTLGVFVDSLILIRHGFWLFEDAIADAQCSEPLRKDLSHFIKLFSWVDDAQFYGVLMNKSGAYRKKIEYSEQLVEKLKLENRRFPDEQQVKKLLVSERFNLLQINLLQMLVEHAIQIKSVEQDNRTLASTKLEESLNQAKLSAQGHSYMEVAQTLLSQRKLLIRSLLTGNWLGDLFEPHVRQNYRNAWLDVLAGVNELQTLWLLDVQLDALTPKNNKLCQWFDMKIEHLVDTISQSHQHAVSIIPYWRQ